MLLLVTVVVCALGGAAISYAGNDPLSQVARCANGGWKQLEPRAGGVFTSETGCMRHAASGGAVATAVIRIPHGRLSCLDPDETAVRDI
jgi:hypothetical protein